MTVQKRYPNFENSKEWTWLPTTVLICWPKGLWIQLEFFWCHLLFIYASSNVELTTRSLLLSTDITSSLSSWRLVAQMSQVFSIFNSNAFKESYLPPPIKNGFLDVSTYFQALLTVHIHTQVSELYQTSTHSRTIIWDVHAQLVDEGSITEEWESACRKI